MADNVVTFLPIQEGEGDPSPVNIRPIRPRLYIDGIGAVWGGTLNPLTSELISTYLPVILNGEEPESLVLNNWSGSGFSYNFYNKAAYSWVQSTTKNLMCNMLITQTGGYYNTAEGRIRCIGSQNANYCYVLWKSQLFGDSVESCEAKLKELYNNETPLQFVVETQPRRYATYYLTAPQLQQAIQQLGLQMPSALEMRRRVMAASYQSMYGNYQRIEYLESTGVTQYINTGVLTSSTWGFEITFYAKSNISGTTGHYGCIMGGRRSSGLDDFQLTTYKTQTGAGSDFSGTFRRGSNPGYDAGISSRTKQTVSLRNGILTRPDQTTETTVANINYPMPIYLFALNNSSTASQAGSGCRIYEAIFYDGDKKINHFVPCIRKSDSKPGMLDLVTKTFFTNAGTGDFIIPT